jgi:AcrR family transcriptional regulator
MSPSRPIELRRSRERELVQATRALFDERGMQDAPVEQIDKTVGIARGLIYRSFSSKEELYVLTVTDYLEELDGVLADAIAPRDEPDVQLAQWARAYAGFCAQYPAFLDCALSLMRRPAGELQGIVSELVWLRLGQGMADCISHVSEVLRRGQQRRLMAIPDPDYTANVLWTQTLGIMHLARIRVGLRQAAPGIPALFALTTDRVVDTCISNALAAVGIVPARPPEPT